MMGRAFVKKIIPRTTMGVPPYTSIQQCRGSIYARAHFGPREERPHRGRGPSFSGTGQRTPPAEKGRLHRWGVKHDPAGPSAIPFKLKYPSARPKRTAPPPKPRHARPDVPSQVFGGAKAVGGRVLTGTVSWPVLRRRFPVCCGSRWLTSSPWDRSG
jgi:hypothetical protein